MISERDRGRGRNFGGRGHGFVGGGRGLYGGRQSSLKKGPDNAGIVDVVVTSPRSAGRNLVDLSGHCFLSLILLLRIVLLKTFVLHLHSSWIFHDCTTQKEYGRLQ